MEALELRYFPFGDSGFVKDYFEELYRLKPKALARLSADLKGLASFGLRCPLISVRSLGNGLWELRRLYNGVYYRICFCIKEKIIWLLLAFEKKTDKTPLHELNTARQRMREVMLK